MLVGCEGVDFRDIFNSDGSSVYDQVEHKQEKDTVFHDRNVPYRLFGLKSNIECRYRRRGDFVCLKFSKPEI